MVSKSTCDEYEKNMSAMWIDLLNLEFINIYCTGAVLGTCAYIPIGIISLSGHSEIRTPLY